MEIRKLFCAKWNLPWLFGISWIATVVPFLPKMGVSMVMRFTGPPMLEITLVNLREIVPPDMSFLTLW